jgi:hypothetical protein
MIESCANKHEEKHGIRASWHELQRTSVARSVYEKHLKRVTDMIRSKSSKIKFL